MPGQKIDSEFITLCGSAYRYENGNFQDNSRTWEFSVREYVFIGKSEYILTMFDTTKNMINMLFAEMGIPFKYSHATDNFYPSKYNMLKARIQDSLRSKTEIVVKINKENLAVGSFNFHNKHFSQPFNFSQNGIIKSGCVGFGLERFITMLLEYNISITKLQTITQRILKGMV